MPRSKSPSMRSDWPFWFRLLGSVWCAAFLLAVLAVILIASTTIESKLGTARAQRLIYQTHWFDAFLALLGMNIAVSTVLRWPFKKKHTGFIVTHIGILLLLAGSLMTRLTGMEGQMLLFEGEHSNQVAAPSSEIIVGNGRSVTAAYPLESLKAGRVFHRLPDGTELTYQSFRENAELETTIEENGAQDNPAIRIKIASELAGFGESFWLVHKDPSDPGSASKALGPAILEIHPGELPAETPVVESPAGPKLVFHKSSQPLAEIPLSPLPSGPVDVGSTGYRLEKVQYWPDARVGENNKLVSISDEPNNPAVEAELVAPDGSKIRLVRFTHFPDFESMHAKPGGKRPDFDVELAVGISGPPKPKMPTLAFYAGKNWQFLFRSPKGSRSSGVIEEGKTYPAGWMDFQFTVERLIQKAKIRHTARNVSGKSGQPMVWVEAKKDSQSLGGAWLSPSSPLTLADGTALPVVLRQRMLPVPFTIILKDFRKVDYPGTTRPASFESDATLEDPSEGFSMTRTIKMNKPMDYKGYRVFQSSYIQEPGQPDASVFTIAKNPGIPLIYGGSIILFLGVFITFFVPALSSLTLFKN